jgi:hypothetical protein
MHELAKAYDPSAIEQRWAEKWVQEKLFHAATPPVGEPVDARIFTMLLPPPNVTGRLHMGHMLNQTEADIITRWHRMRGDLALWLPGTDHAGIATQMMVERQLATEKTTRQEVGREKFIERVWQWREHYGGAIQAQMKRLGASVDWSREYFTMDEGLVPALHDRDLGPRSGARGDSRQAVRGALSRCGLERVHHRSNHAAGDYPWRYRHRSERARRALQTSARQESHRAADEPRGAYHPR